MTPRRPRPLDAVLIGLLVLIVAGVVVVQFRLSGESGVPSARPQPGPTASQWSTGDPSPDPSAAAPTSSAPTSSAPASSAPVSASGAVGAAKALQSSLAAHAQSLASAPPAVFRVATLNVLGSSHTGSRGDEAARPAGVTRMARTVQVLAQHQVQVVGLQEFETVQARAFLAQTGGTWQIYPGLSGDTRDAIAWRTDAFDLVRAQTVQVPYFNGSMVPMPVVLLRERGSGKVVCFFNVHNSADTYKYHHQQVNRTNAMAREVQLIDRLHAAKIPVIFTGDLNERDAAYCLLTTQAPLHAAYGGTNDRASGCQAPSIGGSVPIDWIFGTPDVTFTEPVMDHSGLVRAATDHPFYAATATLR